MTRKIFHGTKYMFDGRKNIDVYIYIYIYIHKLTIYIYIYMCNIYIYIYIYIYSTVHSIEAQTLAPRKGKHPFLHFFILILSFPDYVSTI